MDTQLVWARDPVEGYIQCRIGEIGAKDFEVIPLNKKFGKRSCPVEDIHSSCDGPQDHDDNCKYMASITLLFIIFLRRDYFSLTNGYHMLTCLKFNLKFCLFYIFCMCVVYVYYVLCTLYTLSLDFCDGPGDFCFLLEVTEICLALKVLCKEVNNLVLLRK